MTSKFDFIPWDPFKPLLIPHLSSATGDTIHVAAALVLYERLDVIVVHNVKVGSCEGLLNFYRGITNPNKPVKDIPKPNERVKVIPNKRVKVVYTEDDETAYKIYTALTNPDRNIKTVLTGMFERGVLPFLRSNNLKVLSERIEDVQEFSNLYLNPDALVPRNPPTEYTFVGNLGQATAAIAYKFNNAVIDINRASQLKQIYTDLATGLSRPIDIETELPLPPLAASKIIVEKNGRPMFGSKPLPRFLDGPVALLWARYTGTSSLTEYNPEGDSSVQGQAQLLKLLKDLKFNVITIGHGPRGGNPVKSEFDVGEFYLQQPITPDRASQTSFFLALMQTYPGGLFQIGQKTGGMDCAALLGVPTLYLEHKDSHSYWRMQKWVGKVPFYQNSTIELPPSRIGASLRMTFNEIDSFNKLYKWGQTDPESKPRPSAKTRYACMLYKYPAEMGEKRMAVQAVVDWVNTVKDWDESGKKIPATEFKEVQGNPEADGKLAKQIRTVNLSAPGAGPGPVGYTAADLDGIKAKLKQLQADYSAKTAIIRTAGGSYETRQIMP